MCLQRVISFLLLHVTNPTRFCKFCPKTDFLVPVKNELGWICDKFSPLEKKVNELSFSAKSLCLGVVFFEKPESDVL